MAGGGSTVYLPGGVRSPARLNSAFRTGNQPTQSARERLQQGNFLQQPGCHSSFNQQPLEEANALPGLRFLLCQRHNQEARHQNHLGPDGRNAGRHAH
ncbi:hypothetical protein O181_079514 [Austropuccinia psidii MF-1]|uniref:Uncharacterized protein n=1 Tax=Austropuccinia psidii MF-1 TaxID=1389203 RepID=A0A9Q3IIA7_9BASI|nr:hypothetical protein [Austropuccinia psidii MF-1]